MTNQTTFPRPKLINALLVMILVLAALNAISLVSSSVGMTRPGGNFTPGGQPGGARPQNDNPQSGGRQNNNGSQNRQLGRGGTGAFNLFSLTRSMGVDPQALRYVTIGLTVAGVALLLLSAYGLWKQKRWGMNLAMALGILLLISALSGVFSPRFSDFLSVMRWSAVLLQAVLAAAIAVIGILPSARETLS